VEYWRDIRLLRMQAGLRGALGTMLFDWRCTRHALRQAGLVLVLGYNTALFAAAYRLAGRRCVINMDGLEWRRGKYGPGARLWLWANEWLGARLGDHLVADHPEIERHVRARAPRAAITMIPYGARVVGDDGADLVREHALEPRRYALLIARPEPENSILEIVRAFSAAPRGWRLAVLGRYDRANAYQRRVLEAAGDDVVFLGAIYERARVDALRAHAALYVHGHTVGGTNPSLVEALGAGVPVLAHDNAYNRWVAGDAGVYFLDEADCAGALDRLCAPDAERLLDHMRDASRARHAERFTLERNLAAYEAMLARCAGVPPADLAASHRPSVAGGPRTPAEPAPALALDRPRAPDRPRAGELARPSDRPPVLETRT
jgi:glycosyltransferase involved in cell wall biosynthesis